MRRRFALALFAVTIAAISCGDDSNTDVARCVPGDAKACAGKGACSGRQVCKADGTYDACSCENAGEGGAAGGGSMDKAGDAPTAGNLNESGAAGVGGEPTVTGAAGAAGMSGAAGAAGGGPVVCNPLTQAPCAVGERCAWVTTGNHFEGHTDCLPDGTLAAGVACARDAMGLDDCKRGLACVDGTCQTLCDLDAQSGCEVTSTCVKYSAAAFNPNGDGPVGFCALTCNPLTQKRSDGAEACGSAEPGKPNKGCYGLAGSAFACAPAGPADKISGVTPLGSSPSDPYINGCAPGFLPLLLSGTGATDIICTATCEPAPTSTSTPGNAGGKIGSTKTCAAKGAGGTHECRYWWSVEDPGAAGYPSSLGNAIGYCMDYTKYRWDSNRDNTIDLSDSVQPSCASLSPTAHTYDPTLTDNVYWGCAPLP